jgi:hypothetical protein
MLAINKEVPYGFCHCGCGKLTHISKKTSIDRGITKGEPFRFLRGHNGFKEIKKIGTDSHGYKRVWVPDRQGSIREHVLVAENMNCGPLAPGSVIHHKDKDKTNNNPDNLVICSSHSDHMEIHRSEKALKACGHSGWKKCRICKQYDNPTNLYVNGRTVHHRKCARDKQRDTRSKSDNKIQIDAPE